MAERFEEAIDQGRPDKLRKLLAGTGGEEPIGLETAEEIVGYLKAHPETKDEVVRRLETEAQRLKEDSSLAFGEDEESAFVYVEKRAGKRWLLYDDYGLGLKRYEVPVTTTYAGSKIWLDGSEAGIAGTGASVLRLGPLLPGEYAVKAVYEGKYTTLEREETVELFPLGGSFDRTVDIPLEGDYVDVFANNSFAKIFLNGEDLGLAVEDGQRIGPIETDGSNVIRLEARYPWGIVRSEEMPIEGGRLELELPALGDEDKEKIAEAAYAFIGSWYEAYNLRDAKALRHAHPDRAADLAARFAEMVAADEHYEGEMERAEFDMDSLRMVQYDETEYTVFLKARVDYREAYYYGAYDTIRPDPIEDTQYAEYQLEYESGQWTVSGWTNVDPFEATDAKVFE